MNTGEHACNGCMKITGCRIRKRYLADPRFAHMEDCTERVGDAPEVVKRRQREEDPRHEAEGGAPRPSST